MTRACGALGLVALAAASWLAPEVAGQPDIVPARYDRVGTGFRDTFERLKANGYDKYLADLAAAHPSHRALAATMLGVIGDPRAIGVLRSFVASETWETTRHQAYVGLVLLGDVRYLGELLQALTREIPEDVASAARSFRVLAEYDIALPAAVIDELLRRLDHADSSVKIDAATALQLATGISFGFRADVSNPGAYAHALDAWRAWWKDNRGRYPSKQNYIVNGLELRVSNEGGVFTATFHNHGPAALRMPAPAPDTVKARREITCEPFSPALSLVDARGAAVEHLRSDTSPCTAHFVPSDDVLHWESIELKPGAAYSFRLPAVATKERVALAYATAACGAGRWCGEVRSNVLGR